MTAALEPCPQCGAAFEPVNGAVHKYFGESPACWEAFNVILAREFQDPAYFAVHRLSVDAYAVQHPGDPADRRAVQSVNVHLTALYIILELNRSYVVASNAMKSLAATYKRDFQPLSRPRVYDMTVKDILPAQSAKEHCDLVRAWANSVWRSWSAHHDVAKMWAKRLEL